ncbi:hypothetical protein ZHAS_00001565 [Anopheles sinensis]|uniref:Uncharacterized protein n=1 Tax=Anopheles sinensis TaxID=74873 RepID=A0A084VBG1_ANOSI|nr:hypothetical protein ZHAS_00001565 [Anopheles sinensis]
MACCLYDKLSTTDGKRSSLEHNFMHPNDTPCRLPPHCANPTQTFQQPGIIIINIVIRWLFNSANTAGSN